MVSEWWASAAVVGLAMFCLCGTSTLPAAPIVAGHALGPDLAPLEARVGAHPKDARALEALVEAYLEHSAPGLAQAAIDRAPADVRALPPVADARARALEALGLPRVALEAERRALGSCAERHCSRSLVGHALLRSRWLAELVQLGVTDPEAQPELAMLAYRRSVREVRLDVH
jgi:hypothetical protein